MSKNYYFVVLSLFWPVFIFHLLCFYFSTPFWYLQISTSIWKLKIAFPTFFAFTSEKTKMAVFPFSFFFLFLSLSFYYRCFSPSPFSFFLLFWQQKTMQLRIRKARHLWQLEQKIQSVPHLNHHYDPKSTTKTKKKNRRWSMKTVGRFYPRNFC